MSIKRVAIKGGYRFKSFCGKPSEEIVTLSSPDAVTVALPADQALELSIAAGDVVKAGQIIARNDDTVSNPNHAPISGKVTKIGPSEQLGKQVQTIVIEADTTDSVALIEGASENWSSLSEADLQRLIYLSGAAGLDPSGIPTTYKSAHASGKDITDLVINCIEADLFPVSTSLLIKETGLRSFADGCKMLAKIMPAAKLHVVVNRELGPLAEELSEELPNASMYAVKPEYPAGRDEVIMTSVLKRPFPYGFTAADAGVIIVSASTVVHVVEAVTSGVSVVERILAVGGAATGKPTHVRVRVGSPVSSVLAAAGEFEEHARLVADSLLTGSTIEDIDTPVQRNWVGVFAVYDGESSELVPFAQPGFRKDSYTNTFAALALPWLSKKYDTNLKGERRACLSCSYCAEVCPVGILPNLLHKYAEREIIDEDLLRYKIFDCIDCNLCTYVCPSKIPVADLMKRGKDMLQAEGISDRERVKAQFDISREGAE